MLRKQHGFTTVELMVVLAILGILSVILVPSIQDQMLEAKIEGSVEQARQVLAACNLVRVKPRSSYRDPTTLKVTHTYGQTYSSWTDVSVLQSRLTGSYFIPNANAFGRPYLFQMYPDTCVVAVEVDQLVDGWMGYQTESDGVRTKIIVGTSANDTLSPWVLSQKRSLNDETFR
jgi:prepilin-type N-terminal cleavage/methylation domain-containing protein